MWNRLLVRGKRWQPENQTKKEPGNASWCPDCKDVLVPSPDGILLDVWSRLQLAHSSIHSSCADSSNCLLMLYGFLSFGFSQCSLIKLCCQKLCKVTPFIENVRGKLREDFLLKLPRRTHRISHCLKKIIQKLWPFSLADFGISCKKICYVFIMCQSSQKNTDIIIRKNSDHCLC